MISVEGVRVKRQYSIEQANKFADLIEEFHEIHKSGDEDGVIKFIENNQQVVEYKEYHNSIMYCVGSMNRALGALTKYVHYNDDYLYFVSDNNTAADIIQYHFIKLEFVEFVKAKVKPIERLDSFSSDCEICDVELIEKVLKDV